MFKVLVVEDHLNLRDQIVAIVNDVVETPCVYSAGNANEALKLSTEHVIDLFLIDIGLPDLSGLGLVKILRKNKNYYRTPVIFITADTSKELEAYRSTHCHSFLSKPFSQERLANLIIKIRSTLSETDLPVEKKLLLKFKTHSQWLYEKDIYCVEYINRKIRIHFKETYLDYKTIPLKEFHHQLSEKFLQIHQSIIIHRDKVEQINISERMIYLFNQSTGLPIGRNYVKQIIKELNQIDNHD